MASICQHFDTLRELKFNERVELPIEVLFTAFFLQKWKSNITDLPFSSIIDSDKLSLLDKISIEILFGKICLIVFQKVTHILQASGKSWNALTLSIKANMSHPPT